MTGSKIFDVMLGVTVLGTVGGLIGTFMGGGFVFPALILGGMLGAGVGFLGGRQFFLGIFVGTIFGGLLAWGIAGEDVVTVGAASGAAMGGFLGIWTSMLWDMFSQGQADVSSSVVDRQDQYAPSGLPSRSASRQER